MPSAISARLASRAAVAGLPLPHILLERLVAYFELLQRWNRTINLTSLSDPDEAIDRLLLEPVAASESLPQGVRLMDLGSGGGSPAIPLALSGSASRLVMVESRSRKAAFLREAIRELGLPGVVENARFEETAAQPTYRGQIDIVSVRAVKLDMAVLEAAAAFLTTGGRLAIFESVSAPAHSLPIGLALSESIPLLARAKLTVVVKV